MLILYKQKDQVVFLKNLGKVCAKAGRKIATNALKNPGRSSEIASNIAIAAATKSCKTAFINITETDNFL